LFEALYLEKILDDAKAQYKNKFGDNASLVGLAIIKNSKTLGFVAF